NIQEGHLFTPCAYAFLTSKRTAAYTHVFRALKALGIVNEPTTLSTDFEIALSNGFLAVFPTTKISRCAFHLYQAVLRKIQNRHLTQLYDNANTKHFFKGLMALSLIPSADVPAYFDALKHEATQIKLLVPGNNVEVLYDYFERTNIGVKDAHSIRVCPMHPVDTWSIYDRIISHSQIGNSTTEAFNATLQAVPPHSTAQKVASILAEHDRIFQKKHDFASGEQKMLQQAYPQKHQTANMQIGRFDAVSNGAMGKTPFKQLTDLCVHIHIQQ
ncbi:hypothetical protein PENTCL1PPCAC_10199, partial [Pristionchus entomophagus]